ncbi:MAG: methyltransferase, partial [Bacteroidaceae bacterium]|nr:methyltransferase [Bacteroidaceae bacterium]
LAKQMKGTSVTAWDISSRALEVARQNNVMCGTDVCFEKQDVFAKIENDDSLKYDVIVSNPPYVRNSEKQEMNLNVLDWEPESALFVSDDDPLLFYRRIAILGLTLLKPDGFLYFEINRAFGQEVVSLLKKHHYQQVRLLKDFYGNDRIVSAKR